MDEDLASTEAPVSRFGFAALVAANLFVFCGAADGQETSARGAAFVELAGNSLLGATGNAELYLGHGIGARVGVGRDFYSQTGVFPLQAVMLLGSGHSKLEVAAGVTVAHEGSDDWDWDGTKAFFTGFFGYRHQRPQGFLFRVGVIPLLWTNAKVPWIAIGLGTSF
jgi:hypothetical protein